MEKCQELVCLKKRYLKIADLIENLGSMIDCSTEIDALFYEIELSKVIDNLLIAEGNLKYLVAPLAYTGSFHKYKQCYFIDKRQIEELDIVEVLYNGIWIKTMLFKGVFHNIPEPQEGTPCRIRTLPTDSYKNFVFETIL